jgi:hypothetical protein
VVLILERGPPVPAILEYILGKILRQGVIVPAIFLQAGINARMITVVIHLIGLGIAGHKPAEQLSHLGRFKQWLKQLVLFLNSGYSFFGLPVVF